MFRVMEVFGRMFVLGGIAAANMSTNQTQAQMHPAISNLKTFLAALSAGGDVANFFHMTARGLNTAHDTPNPSTKYRSGFLIF
jgi:hypothetical protein